MEREPLITAWHFPRVMFNREIEVDDFMLAPAPIQVEETAPFILTPAARDWYEPIEDEL